MKVEGLAASCDFEEAAGMYLSLSLNAIASLTGKLSHRRFLSVLPAAMLADTIPLCRTCHFDWPGQGRLISHSPRAQARCIQNGGVHLHVGPHHLSEHRACKNVEWKGREHQDCTHYPWQDLQVLCPTLPSKSVLDGVSAVLLRQLTSGFLHGQVCTGLGETRGIKGAWGLGIARSFGILVSCSGTGAWGLS